MGAVVSRQAGIRTARRISHCFIMDVPKHADALIITDAAVNIAPTLDDKVDIVQNAIDLAHAMGVEEVRVAILSAIETVSSRCRPPSKLPHCARWPTAVKSPVPCWMGRSRSTMQSVRLPLQSRRSHRRLQDVQMSSWFPTWSRKQLAKSLSFLAQADAAGIVLGARVPDHSDQSRRFMLVLRHVPSQSWSPRHDGSRRPLPSFDRRSA